MWKQYHIVYTKLFRNSFTKMVQFSCLVMSDSLRPHGLQHARFPCPSPTPRACPNSCLSSWWYHLTILSSVVPFSSHLQSFPVSGSFPMSQLFASVGQSIGASASASVLPMNIQDWFLLGLTGLISLQSKGLKRLLQHHSSKASVLPCSSFSMVQLWHPYVTTGKTIALTRWTKMVHLRKYLPWYVVNCLITLKKDKPMDDNWIQMLTLSSWTWNV